jgi:hypothetical protein
VKADPGPEKLSRGVPSGSSGSRTPDRANTAAQRAPRPPQPAGASRRKVPLAVVLGVMLLGGLGALLALNTASAALEVENRTISGSNAATSDTEQQLVRELADKQAPTSLASAARSLGMVPNPNPAFLRINADGSVNVLGSPTPATAPPPPPPSSKPKPKPKPSATASSRSSNRSSRRPAPTVTVTVTAGSSKRPSTSPSPTTSKQIAAPLTTSSAPRTSPSPSRTSR